MYPERGTAFYTKWVLFFDKIRAYKRDSLSDGVGKLLDEALGTDSNDSELGMCILFLTTDQADR